MIGFVIPAYKEPNIGETVSKLYAEFPDCFVIVVADDWITAERAKRATAFVPFHTKKLGFGKSLVEGLCMAWYTFECDVVVTMDVDHPVEDAKKLIAKLKNSDVCVGYERGSWKLSRKLANGLVRFLLFKDIHHPTCGFVAWKGDILREIPWKHVKSSWDAIHPELLFWAWKRGAKLSEEQFSWVSKERKYSLKRHLSWFISFLRLLRLKYLWFWRDFY